MLRTLAAKHGSKPAGRRLKKVRRARIIRRLLSMTCRGPKRYMAGSQTRAEGWVIRVSARDHCEPVWHGGRAISEVQDPATITVGFKPQTGKQT